MNTVGVEEDHEDHRGHGAHAPRERGACLGAGAVSTALLVTALVLMLLLQVSTHVRIAGLMARLPREVENHASAKHVGDVARSLQACCDRVAEVCSYSLR